MADDGWSVVETKPIAAPPTTDPWAVVKHSPKPAASEDLPWDVPVSGGQMRKEKALAAKSDEAFPEPTEPGLKHLLWGLASGPIKIGQTALGERPIPSGTEALGEAAMGAIPSPVIGRAASALGGGRIPVMAHPMTREGVTEAATAMRAPTIAKAESAVEKRINQTGPTTAQAALDAINAARESGKPMMLPDVLQGGVQKLAGRMARAPGEASEIMTQSLRGRNAGAVERLSGDVNTAFGAEKAYDANQALMAARKIAAKPEYDAAYAHPPINPDEMQPEGAIGAMLERPSIRAGMANARKIAAEEGVDPNTLGIDLDAQGEPMFVSVPTWQALDYMKRGVDNVVEQYRDPTTGKLVLDTYGRAADATRGEFVKTLRDLNPAYERALNAWSGPSQSMDAIQVGMDALRRSPEQNAARIAEMSENDREFARLGIGQALRDVANKRGPLASEFDRVAGTQYGSTSTRQQLRPFFKDEASYKKFVDAVTAETTMARTSNKILGGSQTAERLAEDEGPISVSDIASAGAAGVLGHKMGMVNAIKDIGMKLWDRRDPELNAQIARILGSTDVSLGRDAAGRVILRRPEPPP